MAVTSLDKLKELANGQEVELLGWGEDAFVCKLKRPSLLGLVSTGQIPNPLLNSAHILFYGPQTSKDVISMKDQRELLEIIAKAAMVEPTYEQLNVIGLELTDAQLNEIYNFTQAGVQALELFRKKQSNNEDNKK